MPPIKPISGTPNASGSIGAANGNAANIPIPAKCVTIMLKVIAIAPSGRTAYPKLLRLLQLRYLTRALISNLGMAHSAIRPAKLFGGPPSILKSFL